MAKRITFYAFVEHTFQQRSLRKGPVRIHMLKLIIYAVPRQVLESSAVGKGLGLPHQLAREHLLRPCQMLTCLNSLAVYAEPLKDAIANVKLQFAQGPCQLCANDQSPAKQNFIGITV